MAISALPHRLRSMSTAVLLLSQHRAIANAAAAVERDRRAAALRTADESADLEAVMGPLVAHR